MITIFTPTYNRAHLLNRLYKSLQKQDCFDFEWLVIDDGSNDNTNELFDTWKKEPNKFDIRYIKIENGGKQRAINKAYELANGEYFFIVDSDDYLLKDAVSFINQAFKNLPDDESFIGISGVKANFSGKPLGKGTKIKKDLGYVDGNYNIRKEYGLEADMAEAFFTSKMKKYIFPVWENEKFTPEDVVWIQMALDGYKLRWFDKIIYCCEYQEKGLTKSSWKLLKENPMGYAMLFNKDLLVENNAKYRLKISLLFISCCFLANKFSYIFKCNYKRYFFILVLLGWLLSLRRKYQIRQFCK